MIHVNIDEACIDCTQKYKKLAYPKIFTIFAIGNSYTLRWVQRDKTYGPRVKLIYIEK